MKSKEFSISYQQLSSNHRSVFRLLSLHPGDDVTVPSTAALSGLTEYETAKILDGLLDVNLVTRKSGRYRIHDLARGYLKDCGDAEVSTDVRQTALKQLNDWYLHTSHAAMRLIAPAWRLPDIGKASSTSQSPTTFPNYAEALDWCEAERRNLTSAVLTASANGAHKFAWQLPQTLFGFFYLKRYHDDWINTCVAGLESARILGDRWAQARILDQLGNAYSKTNRRDEAVNCFQEAITLYEEVSDRKGLASSMTNLGAVYDDQERFVQAIEQYQAALPIRKEIGDLFGEGNTLNNLGESYRSLGQLEQALDCYTKALPLRRAVSDRFGESATLTNLGDTYRALGDLDQGFQSLEQALHISLEIDDKWGEARSRSGIAHIHLLNGDKAKAVTYWTEALAIFTQLEDSQAEEIQTYLSPLKPEGSTAE